MPERMTSAEAKRRIQQRWPKCKMGVYLCGSGYHAWVVRDGGRCWSNPPPQNVSDVIAYASEKHIALSMLVAAVEAAGE